MLKIIIPYLLIVLVEGGFFDLTDVEDPLALLWNNIPQVQHHLKFSECKIDNIRIGVCMDKPKCIFSGGTPTGHCGIMYTCCSYEQNCDKSSDKKQSYFTITNLSNAVTNCKYTIKLRNKNVCQVRLDFEDLILAPATPSGTPEIYKCSNDELRIKPDYYGVPSLCGNNTNQHLYVHVNQSADTDVAINIDINLANRLTTIDLPKPTWKIKFTQLECPVRKSKFDIFKYKDFDDITNDFSILAPHGAIQYFTEPQGQISSFGNIGTIAAEPITSYPYLEHYTIAFRRPSNVCGIMFTTVILNLYSGGADDCKHYLFIPELNTNVDSVNTLGASQYEICTSSSEPKSVYKSYPPGPIYVIFSSMNTEGAISDSHRGFQLNYELINNNNCLT